MKYPSSLAKKEREQIFTLFLDKYKLKFSDIEKKLSLRSNMVAYHIEQMQKEGLLQKQGIFYSLTREGEQFIPHFSQVSGRTLMPMPVILVAPVKGGKVLLVKRNKRPYKDYWGLPGGKMLFAETFADACDRQLREHSIVGKFLSLNAIVQERVEEKNTFKHSFLLFFVKAQVKSSEGRWFTKAELKREKIIPSDKWLLEHKLSAKVDVKSVVMQEEDGELSAFRIAN
jgi:ADP-ribose pyrophosphatase YjhB (NUDIX family)